jgi:hypothetical protein
VGFLGGSKGSTELRIDHACAAQAIVDACFKDQSSKFPDHHERHIKGRKAEGEWSDN